MSLSMLRNGLLRVVGKNYKNVMREKIVIPVRYFNEGTDFEEVPVSKTVVEKGLNKVYLLGRVGSNPELRGKEPLPVAIFSLATSYFASSENGPGERKTLWHRIVTYNSGLREKIVMNLRQGDRVFVSGRIDYREYQTASNEKRQLTSIVAHDVINFTKRYMNEQIEKGEESE